MLEHHQSNYTDPARVAVIGARGVLGKELTRLLGGSGIDVLPLTSDDVDLVDDGAAEKLAGLLRPDDAVVMLAGLTPDKGRDVATLMKNLKMVEAVCGALAQSPCGHVIYLSSDAVYPMVEGLIIEETPAAPPDLYGVMHRTRELMCTEGIGQTPLAILRCSIVCAATDTHNSYGPNRFRKEAREKGTITLFGNGEETRDHVMVGDVAEIIRLVLGHRSSGLLNIATGRSASFYEVAQMVAALFDPPPEIICNERSGPITHRHFDITACHRSFPKMRFTPLEEGIARVHDQVVAGS